MPATPFVRPRSPREAIPTALRRGSASRAATHYEDFDPVGRRGFQTPKQKRGTNPPRPLGNNVAKPETLGGCRAALGALGLDLLSLLGEFVSDLVELVVQVRAQS
jgi:hypothetical protein